MPDALDHIDALTRSRDREAVDATLLSALIDLLPVRRVMAWRLIGEPGTPQHWLRTAAQSQGELVAAADFAPADVATLPSAEAMPRHLACLRGGRAVDGDPDAAGATPVRLLPMAGDVSVIGVIELQLDATLDARDERIARSLLKIHRNFLSLLDYSERDTLTGLLNRKSFDDTFLKATVLEASRQFDPNAPDRRLALERRHFLGVIDVDHFKAVNDRHGHLIGDEVLVLVARLMGQTFRFDDRLYRFGGEEFVVLLTAADDIHAGAAFERLREHIADYPFPRVGHITVSIGYSDVRPGDTPQAAFERADQAVYWGKENGRNRVCSHSTLISRGELTASDDASDIELF